VTNPSIISRWIHFVVSLDASTWSFWSKILESIAAPALCFRPLWRALFFGASPRVRNSLERTRAYRSPPQPLLHRSQSPSADPIMHNSYLLPSSILRSTRLVPWTFRVAAGGRARRTIETLRPPILWPAALRATGRPPRLPVACKSCAWPGDPVCTRWILLGHVLEHQIQAYLLARKELGIWFLGVLLLSILSSIPCQSKAKLIWFPSGCLGSGHQLFVLMSTVYKL
jgi:hypothetical protein